MFQGTTKKRKTLEISFFLFFIFYFYFFIDNQHFTKLEDKI